MYGKIENPEENNSKYIASNFCQNQLGGLSTFQLLDNRPKAIQMEKLQEVTHNSARVKKLNDFQKMADNSTQVKQASQFQVMADNYAEQHPIQKKQNNTGLPDTLKTGIENLSGYSMDDVKVHYNSDKPAQLQAHAYAQGTDIHLASGQEKHLPHEAWHAVQQKQGKVRPTMSVNGAEVNDNVGLENEADVMGAKALQMKGEVGKPKENRGGVVSFSVAQRENSLKQGFGFVDNRQDRITKNPNGTVQRRLSIQTGAPDTLIEYGTANEAFDDIYGNVGMGMYDGLAMSNVMVLKEEGTKRILGSWISASEWQVIRGMKGQSPKNKFYTSHINLGTAVLSEVDSEANLEKEETLARDVGLNNLISGHIDTLMAKIKIHLDNEADSDAKAKLTGRWANYHRGKYWPTYYASGFWNVLNSPGQYPTNSKVAVIHDITDYYWDNNNAVVDVPAGNQLMSSYADDGNVYKYDMATYPLNTVRSHGTIMEDSPFIISVRHHKMPIDVGPSFTTGRFMQLADTVGATGDEKEAIAWGLFAYWNQDYYKSASGVHRFHFVMDMASNFGVPYNTFHYPDDSPTRP